MDNGTTLAPVVLFTYSRLDHAKQTVEALLNNTLSSETELIVYSDGPKNEKVKKSVEEVRNYLHTITGFKSVKIIEQPENCGLSKNIITGVTNTVNEYGKVIVIEDDIVTGKYFLEYMNNALNRYENDKEVWHIAGWRVPTKSSLQSTAYFHPVMDCYGWGTWKDRWQFFEKDPKKYINMFTDDNIDEFNIDNTCHIMYKQITMNNEGTLNTWAIFWYAAIFVHNGLCLAPSQSLVKNIGFDSSGQNSGKMSQLVIKNPLDMQIKEYPDVFRINRIEYQKDKKFYKKIDGVRMFKEKMYYLALPVYKLLTGK